MSGQAVGPQLILIAVGLALAATLLPPQRVAAQAPTVRPDQYGQFERLGAAYPGSVHLYRQSVIEAIRCTVDFADTGIDCGKHLGIGPCPALTQGRLR